MRMKVVLPLPLGPRKPQISPGPHLQVNVVDDRALAEALGHAAHVDGQVRRSSLRPEIRTSTGWPGCSFAATAGSKRDLDHEDQLARGSPGCRSPAACIPPAAR